MAKPQRPAPRSNGKARAAKPAALPRDSYFETLSQTLGGDEYELMLPKTMHGVRRASVHRKIS